MTIVLGAIETGVGDLIASRNTLTPTQCAGISLLPTPGFYEHQRIPGLALRPLDKTKERGFGLTGLALVAAEGGAVILVGQALAAFFRNDGKFVAAYRGPYDSYAADATQERIPDTGEKWVSSSSTTSYVETTRFAQRILPTFYDTNIRGWPKTYNDAASTVPWCAFEVCTGATDGVIVVGASVPYIGEAGSSAGGSAAPANGVGRSFHDGITLVNGCISKILGMGSLHQVAMFADVKDSIIQSYPTDEGVRNWVAANYDRLVREAPNTQMGIEVFLTPDRRAFIQGRRNLEKYPTWTASRYDAITTTVTVRSGETAPGVQTAKTPPYGYFMQPAGRSAASHRNFFQGNGICTYEQQMVEVTGTVLGPWNWSTLVRSTFLGAVAPADTGFIKTRLDGAFAFQLTGSSLSDEINPAISANPGGKFSPAAFYEQVYTWSGGRDNFLYVMQLFQDYLDAAAIDHFA